jgi:hypothetical protein
MRHTATLVAAVVIAPLAWILVAFGQDRTAQALDTADSSGVYRTGDFVAPLFFLAAAGILLGLIATLRFSPLGAVVTGLGYATSYILLLLAPESVLSMFTHRVSIAGRHADLSTPVRTGTTLLLGGVLLVAVVSVGRWRRWPRPAEPDSGPAVEPTSFALPRERPLGGDGLGLDPSGRDTEPALSARHWTGSPQTSANTGRGYSEYGDDTRAYAGDREATWGGSGRIRW